MHTIIILYRKFSHWHHAQVRLVNYRSCSPDSAVWSAQMPDAGQLSKYHLQLQFKWHLVTTTLKVVKNIPLQLTEHNKYWNEPKTNHHNLMYTLFWNVWQLIDSNILGLVGSSSCIMEWLTSLFLKYTMIQHTIHWASTCKWYGASALSYPKQATMTVIGCDC